MGTRAGRCCALIESDINRHHYACPIHIRPSQCIQTRTSLRSIRSSIGTPAFLSEMAEREAGENLELAYSVEVSEWRRMWILCTRPGGYEEKGGVCMTCLRLQAEGGRGNGSLSPLF